jgi:hypothetical protein
MSANPLRIAAGRFLEWGSTFLDDAVPAATLQQFIADSLVYLMQVYRRDSSDWPDRMRSEFSQSLSNAAELGYGIQGQVPNERAWITFLPIQELVLRRFQELFEQSLLQDGFIQPDTGEVMTAMLLLEPDVVEPETRSWMERLLRHVEVRRKDSLPTHPTHSDQDRQLIRHDIALCFVTAARRWDDVRFLNAALKLNDWSYRSYRGRAIMPSLSRYLLALTECELALREVLER